MRLHAVLVVVCLVALGALAAGANPFGFWFTRCPGQGSAAAQTVPAVPNVAPRVQEGAPAAPKEDKEQEERQEKQREARAEALLRQARAGKHAVAKLGQFKVGVRELVSATLEDMDGQTVALVPSFLDAEKHWRPEAGLVVALTALEPGCYEVINTEIKYGVEWVTGVGADSPKTLAELEKRLASRQREPSVVADQAVDTAKSEPAKGTAVGRFRALGEATLDGKQVTTLVMERGTAMTPTVFYLVQAPGRGSPRPARDLAKVAQGLAADDRVEIEYFEFEGKLYALSIKGL